MSELDELIAMVDELCRAMGIDPNAGTEGAATELERIVHMIERAEPTVTFDQWKMRTHADDGRALRTLRCETPALAYTPARLADQYLIERDATTLIATLPVGKGKKIKPPVYMPGLDFTKRHTLYVKPDPITHVRLHLERMTDHDAAMADEAMARRWNAHSESERKVIVKRRHANRPYGVRSQGVFPIKARPVPVETVYVWGQSLVPLSIHRYRTTLVNGGYQWIGHRRVLVGSKTVWVKRKRASVRRKASGAKGKRGPVAKWWSMKERSLPRHWQRATDEQRATAEALELLLRTIHPNQRSRTVVVGRDNVGRDHIVIVDMSMATVKRDVPDSRSMPIREYSRRAALAGFTV